MSTTNFKEFKAVMSIQMDCPSVLEGAVPIELADFYFSAKISNPSNYLWLPQLKQAKLVYTLGCKFGVVQTIEPDNNFHKLDFTIGGFNEISQLANFVQSVQNSLNCNFVTK